MVDMVFDGSVFILHDGGSVMQNADSRNAIKQWLHNALQTTVGTVPIYADLPDHNDFGVGLQDLFGRRLPADFVRAQMEAEIRDLCARNPYISGINNFKVRHSGGTQTVEFTVKLTQGDEMEVTANYGDSGTISD